MKKQFILTVIVTIGLLSIVNGQNSKNFNSKFLENKNHQKTELQKENHTPFSSNKRDIKDIQLHLKETNVYTKKLDSIIEYEYDDITEQLLPYSFIKYSYDANNNLTSKLKSDWNTNTNSWIFSSKYEYTYDANNNLYTYIYSNWDTSTNSWILYSKYELTYDLTISIDNVLAPYNMYVGSNNPILSYFNYNYNGSDFVLYGKEIFYYSDITGINELTDNCNVLIYPNPANDYLMINTTINENLKIEIYTIRGQNVLSAECTNNASQMRIDISQLPAGIYFIRIANNQNNITKKFVKE